jgi:hypothetical protein
MAFTFRPAVRENVGLLIGLIGESGSGKTMTAMRLAKGICADRRFAVIDTEGGRAKHYADFFAFDHGDLTPPFTPERYLEAIQTADKERYPVIIVDSMSHEHAGEGGLLDWQEAELDRMAGQDWKKRDACAMAAWVKPKRAHKEMVQRLLQVRAHLILCFRADPKVKMEKQLVDGKEKTVIVDVGFQPVCEKSLPYEMTVSFLLSSKKPGVPDNPLKLQKQHRSMFLRTNPDDGSLLPISEECGRLIDAWARGAPKPEKAPIVTAKATL